ncbi:MAG: thioredoxin family protein [Pseudomonadota bacterium]
MAKTASTMLALGTIAPDFTLPDAVSGRSISLDDVKSKKVLLIMFICRHCPYVVHIQHELARLGKDYQDKDIGIIAISANDSDMYSADSPENLKKMALELAFTFPLCHDASQKTAIAYRAACTPDFYVFNAERQLVYRGQLDNSRPGNNLPVTGADLRQAIDVTLNDLPLILEQKPSLGCNIKWKPGQEPSYFTD